MERQGKSLNDFHLRRMRGRGMEHLWLGDDKYISFYANDRIIVLPKISVNNHASCEAKFVISCMQG
jgi:hypothetical protein